MCESRYESHLKWGKGYDTTLHKLVKEIMSFKCYSGTYNTSGY
jgi:hypothetical protein